MPPQRWGKDPAGSSLRQNGVRSPPTPGCRGEPSRSPRANRSSHAGEQRTAGARSVRSGREVKGRSGSWSGRPASFFSQAIEPPLQGPAMKVDSQALLDVAEQLVGAEAGRLGPARLDKG